MSKQPKAIKVVYTVLLTNGREFDHEYNVPADADFEKALEFIGEMSDRIFDAMGGKGETPLFLRNPHTVYSPVNVAGVRSTTISTEEYKEFAEKLDRKMGFVKD